jgi:hypothetical protein
MTSSVPTEDGRSARKGLGRAISVLRHWIRGGLSHMLPEEKSSKSLTHAALSNTFPRESERFLAPLCRIKIYTVHWICTLDTSGEDGDSIGRAVIQVSGSRWLLHD